jgi:hypothetical protein
MISAKRIFILGAGFSKPAGMPLATELLSLLAGKTELDEMRDWLDGLRERLAWLGQRGVNDESFTLNIEEVFHYAYFDTEVFRLKQHLARVGRYEGPGTPWNAAEAITDWLSYLEEELRDVILEEETRSDLTPVTRWAEAVQNSDTVITFNYDTLVERALTDVNKPWHHATRHENGNGISVCKLHGSIDWIVAHRSEPFPGLDLLFEKENSNPSEQNTGHEEDDCRLWRCRTRDQLQEWISGRDFQLAPEHAGPRTVGIAGLGAYKELHKIPGLGRVWANGMRALYNADVAIVVGFAMSDFDAMAQMQFAEVARKRQSESRPLPVIVINPCESEITKDRFRRVFRFVDFVSAHHESVDWSLF